MNIALASIYHISAHYGGNEQYFHHLATGLISQGHQVIYYCGFVDDHKDYPYPIHTIPTAHVFHKPIPSISWLQLLENQQPDIFHASGSGIPLAIAAFAAQQKSIPTFLTFQAPNTANSSISKLASTLELNLFQKTIDHFITTTPQNKQYLQSTLKHPSVKFIPMMVGDHITKAKKLTKRQARKQLNLSPKKKYILYVGKLDTHHYYKGVPELLHAIQQLPDSYHLIIIGNGNLLTHYQDHVKQQQLASRITFSKFVPNEQLATYYQAADVFILPSTTASEGFGLVLIESMYWGTPTITTTIIGPYKWFSKHQVTNFIPPHDSAAIAQEIQKQIQHPNPKQITRAKEFAQQFTRDKMVDATLQYYQQALR